MQWNFAQPNGHFLANLPLCLRCPFLTSRFIFKRGIQRINLGIASYDLCMPFATHKMILIWNFWDFQATYRVYGVLHKHLIKTRRQLTIFSWKESCQKEQLPRRTQGSWRAMRWGQSFLVVRTSFLISRRLLSTSFALPFMFCSW